MSVRLDKWLHVARVYKTRTQATHAVDLNRVRVNGQPAKPHRNLVPGDRIEVEMARQSRESLRPYGVAMTYREFEMGHEIRPEALRVFLQWLDEKALKRG